jgi:hypothetical protein
LTISRPMDHAPSGECRQASAFLQQKCRSVLSAIQFFDQGMASVRGLRAYRDRLPYFSEYQGALLPYFSLLS